MRRKNKLRGTGFSKGSFEGMVVVNQGYNKTIDRYKRRKYRFCEVWDGSYYQGYKVRRIFRTTDKDLNRGDRMKVVNRFSVKRIKRHSKYFIGIFLKYTKWRGKK